MNAPSAEPLLRVEDLRTWFPIRRGVFARTRGHVRAVDGVSFCVSRGEVVGLVGESGCGKSTLARTILRLEAARSGGVWFAGTDLLRASTAELRPLRRRLQAVFQDPFDSLNPRMSILQTLTEGMRAHRLVGAADREAAAQRLLAEVELPADALHRFPHEFSGGQRQRIGIARALSLSPDLVICDEAVSALDVSVQAQIINLLMGLRELRGLAYLFIAHDLSVVRQVADRVLVMYLGKIVEDGTAGDVIGRPAHPYTRALISAVPQIGRRQRGRMVLCGDVPSPAAPPPGCPFHTRCPFVREACRRIVPPLDPWRGEGDGTQRRVACIRVNEIVGEFEAGAAAPAAAACGVRPGGSI